MWDDIGATVARLAAGYANGIEGEVDGFVGRLSDPLSYPFLVTPVHRLHWLYLFTFMAVGLLVYLHRKPETQRFRLGEWLAFCLPKAVYRHPSTLLDAKYYVVNGVFLELAFITALVGSFQGFGAALGALVHGPAGGAAATEPTIGAQLLYTMALILAADFGFFVGHYLSHKVPILWEFHKVHHSAAVLNPLTNYRFHPIDRILLGLCIGIATGAVRGAFGFGFKEVALANAAVVILFNLTANLRHSHVWLSYGRRASHVFCSPAQHQIHHSVEDRHVDHNFGLMLTLWDWMAGTLYVPRGEERFRLGLADGEHAAYDGLWRLYTRPLVRAGAMLAAPFRRRATATPGDRE